MSESGNVNTELSIQKHTEVVCAVRRHDSGVLQRDDENVMCGCVPGDVQRIRRSSSGFR